MVTFETPLMFSRSSSIASLGSCEPQEGYIGSSAVSECRYNLSLYFYTGHLLFFIFILVASPVV